MTHETTIALSNVTTERIAPPGRARRILAVVSLTHALHDGYTDLLYVLLPVWRTEFALSYSALALLRGLYAGAMALLQVPAGRLAGRVDARVLLALGTLVAALGYALAGWSGGLIGLGVALVVSGAGSSVQHPIGSSAVSRAYGDAARGPLGIYNFAGDLGKAALPALTSVLVTTLAWRRSLLVLTLGGVVTAVAIVALLPHIVREGQTARRDPRPSTTVGFRILFSIGVLDTAVRMGLLTFLPFLLEAKGASLRTVGLALTLVFAGGAAGKFVCGWIGARIGVVPTVLVTEAATALFIVAALLLPLMPTLVLLPVLGVMLNGTSSVLYGTVPELATGQSKEHAFAVFYTGTIGSGAIAPVLYSLLGDASGPRAATLATALTALAVCPLALGLGEHLGAEKTMGIR